MDKSTAERPKPAAPYWHLLEETLQFELQSAAVSMLNMPHLIEWRTLPCAVCVVMSTGAMLLELDGGQTLEISGGGAYFIPPGVHYRNSLISDRGLCHWAHVNYTVFEGVNLFSLLAVPTVIPPAIARPCGVAVSELARIHHEAQPSLFHAVRKKAFGLMLLAHLAEISSLQQNAQEFAQFSRRVAPALAHIHQHVHESISVEALARQAHLSPSRFHDVFRNAIGMAPRDYIQRLRLQSAQRLLIGTDLAIREIAARVGHSDPFYFSRHFRRHAGMSPLQYRKHVRKSLV